MTLPASGAISMSQIKTELGISGALSLGDSRVRNLAGVPTGPISMSQLRGKSNTPPLNVTPNHDYPTYSSSGAPGTATANPYVLVSGGNGTYAYSWSFVSNPSSLTFNTVTTGAMVGVQKGYLKSQEATFSATLQCVVTSGTQSVTVQAYVAMEITPY